jgi:hypothetical protein
MKPFEVKTHSFIVRIWLEAREIKEKKPEWRGVIEHVSNGAKHNLRDLNEITSFIAPYLREMGVKPSRIQQTVERLRSGIATLFGKLQ